MTTKTKPRKTTEPTFRQKTVFSATAMNTLCIEDVVAALKIFLRDKLGCGFDVALARDRNGLSFWITRDANTITVCRQDER